MERELRALRFSLLQLESFATISDSVPADAVGCLRQHWREDVSQSKKVLANWGKADLLVVDHYGLDARWEGAMRVAAETILAIDDLADRQHDCDMLLDQTFNRNATDYVGLVPKGCRILCGSQYALIRDGFHRLRSDAEVRRRSVKTASRLLVSFGGTDPTNMSSVVLDAIAMLPFRREMHVEVVLTSSALHLEALAAKISGQDYDVRLCVDVADLEPLLLNADLAIGASGTSTWERAVLGLPTITIVTADNQRKVASMVKEAGAILLLDPARAATASMLAEAISSVWKDTDALHRMSAAAFSLCDGLGVERVVEEIFARGCRGAMGGNAPVIDLRLATEADEDTVYMWQGSSGIRRYSRNPEVPALEEHRTWFRHMLCDQSRRLYIVECAGVSAGMIRLDDMNDSSVFEVSILISISFQKVGIARQTLEAVQCLEDVHELRAYVKPDNLASIRLFVGSGFVLECNNWYVWRKEAPIGGTPAKDANKLKVER